jgi:N-acetylmuramoyl-L-alanine amidase
MEKPKFDITYKRKLLYKRKRRRQLIFRLSTILSVICILSLILLLNNKNYVNKKVAFSSNNEEKTIVCIDPGHGDWDIGAKGITGTLEKDIVLDISLKLGKILEENEIKVIYTRTNDLLPWLETANDSLKERIKIPEIFKADLFISIHCNSDLDNKDSKGVETWYKANDENSKNLSQSIQNSLTDLNYTENRDLKTYESKDDALAVLELNKSIPALIELGFLSNSSDERYLNSDRGQEASAKAISEAILKYIQENKNIILEERSKK